MLRKFPEVPEILRIGSSLLNHSSLPARWSLPYSQFIMPMPQIVIWVQRLPHHPSFPRIIPSWASLSFPTLLGRRWNGSLRKDWEIN